MSRKINVDIGIIPKFDPVIIFTGFIHVRGLIYCEQFINHNWLRCNLIDHFKRHKIINRISLTNSFAGCKQVPIIVSGTIGGNVRCPTIMVFNEITECVRRKNNRFRIPACCTFLCIKHMKIGR